MHRAPLSFLSISFSGFDALFIFSRVNPTRRYAKSKGREIVDLDYEEMGFYQMCTDLDYEEMGCYQMCTAVGILCS